MKKWIVIAAGVVTQTALGGIYAWSIFVPYLMDNYGLSRAQCGLIFGVMIAVFTLATIPAGRVLMKFGPKVTAGIGAVLFAGGYIIASFSGGSYALIITGLGVVSGAGIGFGYVCPLTVGVKWFPNSKGMVTGVAVAGFGLGAIILSSISEALLVSMDVLIVFRIAGIGLGVTAFLAAMFLDEPEESENAKALKTPNVPLKKLLFSPQFMLLWLGMFAGTFAGLLVSGNLKMIKLSLGLSEYQAALSISLFAIGNTIGRLVWGKVHDQLGLLKTILFSLGALFLAVIPLLFLTNAFAILSVALLIGFGFGACFVVYASSIVDVFGVKYLPSLYPFCFAGYGLAALLGPAAGGWIADSFGSYSGALMLSAGIVLSAVVLITLFLPPLLQQKEEQAYALRVQAEPTDT
ncbi:MAG: MFS transporter [Spirochaetia bacterium]